MSHLVRIFALMLVFMMTPGATEIVENAAHLVTDGHTAHSIDDADHAPEGDEHGCSGTIHVCACHTSTSFLVMDATVRIPAPALPSATTFDTGDREPAEGHGLGVFRPPAA